jgi:hypothetical protein
MMATIKRTEEATLEKRKKTKCPEGAFKTKVQKNTELALKLLRAYYQI